MAYYYIKKYKRIGDTAGSKAPRDIYALCEKMGMLAVDLPIYSDRANKIVKFCKIVFGTHRFWKHLKKNIKKEDIVFYQHPLYGAKTGIYGYKLAERYILKIKAEEDCKFVALIHDLESLRGGIEGVYDDVGNTSIMADNEFLKNFDVIICHNEHMKQYLIQKGFASQKLIDLEIFDYLCQCGRESVTKGKRPSIAIAGNLALGKCAYIYNLYGTKKFPENQDLLVHLYGTNFDSLEANGNFIYHGSVNADLLPEQLEGDFALVWDGNSIKTCEGNTGNYLKYNNPHKISLYLASGIPVIIWSQAAMADFVKDHGVGIVVENLYDLDKKINDISDDEYRIMCFNACEIGKKIRSGYYFIHAWCKTIDIFEKH